jgi:predicted nucleic acid-binding protein
MRIYADTSFWIATRFFHDQNHRGATAWFDSHDQEDFLWSPWHRVEVFNSIRQMSQGTRQLIREADAKRLIHLLEHDVRLGYYIHVEPDWRNVMRAAQEISATSAFQQPCRSADLLHVAYAAESSADVFVSFDDDQVELARSAGLRAVLPD